MSPSRRLRIGMSASFFHADPQRALFKGKTLLFLEQELLHWVMSQGAYVFMIPSVGEKTVSLSDLAEDLDGLVLQGGVDVSPRSYGEEAMRPEWQGDYIRDCYEIGLIHAFKTIKKPVLGVCRGVQVINVAQGGTLYQDIQTQVPGAVVHRDWQIYDQNFHEIEIDAGTGLSRLYGALTKAKVNTVHHQAVKDLGKELVVEARSAKDGVIEAVRYTGESYMFGVQWHPEWHDPRDGSLLDGRKILEEFLGEARKRREGAV